MGALFCLFYLATLGIVSFFLGRLFAFFRFDPQRFPFLTYPFEKKLYQKLRVRRWQAKVPDMSRIAGKLMPRKNLDGDFHARLDDMVKETCIAELIHAILCPAGFGCVFLWHGAPGWCVSFLYFFGNIPFILIQRYNRPMLCALARSEKHGSRKKEQA